MSNIDYNFLRELEGVIKDRRENDDPKTSYVAKMFDRGINKIAQKVGEEGVETVIAALNEGDEDFIYEGADLLFHILLLCEARGIGFEKLVEELRNRQENGKGVYKDFQTGIAPKREKNPKKFEKNYAFIDFQNVLMGVRNQGEEVDWKKFRIYLRYKYRVTRAFLFLGYLPQGEKFYEKLKEFGFDLIFKPVVNTNSGKVKGNVDAELVLHSAKVEYDCYEQAVLVSGDGDFTCLVEFLKKQGKLKRLLVPNRKRYSSLFRPYSASLDFMNEILHDIKN